jgi:flavin reductase (DIM6/NTAB) family NADH-FMN oxidoreductase RutF
MAPANDFDELMGTLDYPMVVVTTMAGGRVDGCLVGFTTQCSIDPPLLAVCLSDKNRTTRTARGAEALALHLLEPEHRPLAELFGGQTGDDVDKFAEVPWAPGPLGAPLLTGIDRWVVGRIADRIPWGDHVAHLLEVVEVSNGDRRPVLSFQAVKDIPAGHEA